MSQNAADAPPTQTRTRDKNTPYTKPTSKALKNPHSSVKCMLQSITCGISTCETISIGYLDFVAHLKSAHELKGTRQALYFCPHPACSESTNRVSKFALEIHAKRVHACEPFTEDEIEGRTVECPWSTCIEKRLKESSLFRHVTNHANVKFGCPICGDACMPFFTMAKFEKHYKTCHPEEFKMDGYWYIEWQKKFPSLADCNINASDLALEAAPSSST